MSAAAASEAQAEASAPERSWRVRPALVEHIPAVAAAVEELLRELGGTPPALTSMEAAARGLIEDARAGAVLVAEPVPAGQDGKQLVGVLGMSWQSAIHTPGRYALIQDLWVRPGWRSAGVGAGLLAALFALAREQGAARVEVGLPRESFAGIAATEAFYIANGFTALGPRMRRELT